MSMTYTSRFERRKKNKALKSHESIRKASVEQKDKNGNNVKYFFGGLCKKKRVMVGIFAK